MVCPECGGYNIRVVDSRPQTGNTIRRRRSCRCGHRWSTIEIEVDRVTKAEVPESIVLLPKGKPKRRKK